MNAEPAFPFDQDVHAPVIEALDLHDSDSHADAMNRSFVLLFGATAQQHEPECFIVFDAGVDHHFVTFFEDMKRDDDVRK